MGFTREAIEAVGENWIEIERFNAILEHLRARRLLAVERVGAAATAKVVWKILGFQQVILYRIVMLADGCAAAWNGSNPLASALCARAMMETGALVLDFEAQLQRFCDQADFTAIDKLVMNRTFSTRLPGWQTQATVVVAINALKFIDKFAKTVEGARDHYDRLSELCHPNSLGHNFMFGALDLETGTVNLSDTACLNGATFNQVFGGFMVIGFVQNSMSRIEELLPRVLELSEASRRK